MLRAAAEERRFQLVLIKPSHYDDDGYVIRWWRAMTPSNSLAAVYGIAADCAERQVLGPDVAIDIEVIDEDAFPVCCARTDLLMCRRARSPTYIRSATVAEPSCWSSPTT